MTEERDRIVVGVDGSACALEALRWGLDEARRRCADLELVTSWHVPYMAEGLGYASIYLSPDDLTAEARVFQDHALDQLASEVAAARAAGCRIDSRFIEGPPGPALVRESKGAEMLVVGRRGHGAMTRLLLGSVSRYVTTHAACPVVVVSTSD
jgi:nucleotide-binding universal stress UspA family protein